MKRTNPAPFPRMGRRPWIPGEPVTPPRGRPAAYRAHGAVHGAGVVAQDRDRSWFASCGGCRRETSLPRRVRTRVAAREAARAEGWTYAHPWMWVCPSCRFGFGVNPAPTKETKTRAPRHAPRRRVILNVYRVTDGDGNRVAGFGELLSCGHTFVPSDGTQSGNRTRRCYDCLSEGEGSVE